MKKKSAAIIMLLLCLTFAGCGKDEAVIEKKPSEPVEADNTDSKYSHPFEGDEVAFVDLDNIKIEGNLTDIYYDEEERKLTFPVLVKNNTSGDVEIKLLDSRIGDSDFDAVIAPNSNSSIEISFDYSEPVGFDDFSMYMKFELKALADYGKDYYTFTAYYDGNQLTDLDAYDLYSDGTSNNYFYINYAAPQVTKVGTESMGYIWLPGEGWKDEKQEECDIEYTTGDYSFRMNLLEAEPAEQLVNPIVVERDGSHATAFYADSIDGSQSMDVYIKTEGVDGVLHILVEDNKIDDVGTFTKQSRFEELIGRTLASYDRMQINHYDFDFVEY